MLASLLVVGWGAWNTCNMKMYEKKAITGGSVQSEIPPLGAGAWASFQGFLPWSGLPRAGLELTDGWSSAREMHGSKSLSKSCCWGIGILTISCQSSCPYTLKQLCFVCWSSKVLMLFCRQFLRKIYRLSLTPMYISCLLHQASSVGNSKKSFYQGPALIKA